MGQRPLPKDELSLSPRTARAWECAPDGHVVLLVPKFGGVLGRLLNRRLGEPYMRIHLDAIGSTVYQACDGTRTGAQIAEIVASRFPSETNIQGRVQVFLGVLRSQGHIA